MSTINLLCAGCVLTETFPKDCGNCFNCIMPNKNIPFSINYYLMISNNKNEKSTFGRIYKKSMDKFVRGVQ